ncbi:class I SAM-dependent DNA methyltransferase [Altererythrobacter sp.]|uniref:class I SAM-dependent DNA methyltransferase n=1 Tax=Altererythrobacter sp. TaxID=1872480 RepID=UPI001B1314BA|nr:class I SAM-dependent DNA methyltransferase [Altererythrobacter sp.]MBO6609347.1 type I restriction-modification system subunit M [Altererythrobacter sp.]MBO6640652.1 type I restriction-modification system subunit M [Altererythrobacter sp.]MBO6708650.1 type I restriction-modification system subunit M [Altererythrobacter sp.]
MNSSTRQSDLDFAADLFKAADKMRGALEPSEYKHVALGLIFLKYISEAFQAMHDQLSQDEYADPEEPEEYLAENVFWVPEKARWSHIQAQARSENIGKIIDDAMEAIEAMPTNESLKGVLPKIYARPTLDKTMLGELVDLFSNIKLHDNADRARDLLGRVYEYFISGFAGAEGKRGGEFFTPRSVVRTLVEMLEPYEGRVYDPCCGSGGMFIQSEKFIEEHGGNPLNLAVYGQEINHTTWRLAKMNLAVHGIDADIQWDSAGSFHQDKHPTLKADYILANPPFNISDWGGERLVEDARWQYGTPPRGNANFAWLQHIIHHLAPRGHAGVVLANGSMSSQTSGEGEIRKRLIEEDRVDCMVALPGQLFYSTQIPVCLWILSRDKSANGLRDRRGEVLFIDARNLGHMVDRVRRDFSDDDIEKIAGTYRRWRAKAETLDANSWEAYEDEAGFCKSSNLEVIRKFDYVLTPGRYVDPVSNAGNTDFPSEFAALKSELTDQLDRSSELESALRAIVGLEAFND